MKKVLLASSYNFFLKRNSSLLQNRGFELFTATTGAEALKLHKEFLFDLILADFQLEDMNGCTFCSLVRKGEALPTVPLILSCHNLSGSIERVEQSGASAMILKPIDPIQLMETIGRFIDLQIGRSKRVVLKVTVTSKKHVFEFSCYSHDISTTGILLETEFHLELGSRIICRFTLPGSGEIETDGEVVRSLSAMEWENLYGIKFMALPLSSRRAIDSYIASIPDTGSRVPTGSPPTPIKAGP